MAHSPWFAPVVLLLASLIYFSPLLSFGKTVIGTDDGPRGWTTTGNHGHGIESFRDRWSPLNGGTAIMERRYGRFVNPAHLFHLILPRYKARNLEYILWTFVAGILMFLFLRNLEISVGVSLLGALGFMLAPSLQSYVFAGHFARMQVVALMPGVMLLTERMLRKAAISNVILLSVLLALVVYSEHLQLAHFLFFGMGIYFALRMLYSLRKGEISLPVASKRTALFGVALTIGCLLTTMNTFPAMHHTDTTSKRAGGVDYEYASSFALHPEEVVSLVEPDFVGWKEDYWGQNPLKLNSEYFGILFLLLAIILFLLGKQDFGKYLLASYFILALLFALGAHTPVHRIAYSIIPGIKAFRGPSMMYIWFVFPGFVLAAFALESLLELEFDWNTPVGKRLTIFAGIVTALLLLYAVSSAGFARFWYDSIYPAGMQSQGKLNALTHNLKNIRAGGFVVLLLAVGFFTITYLKTTGKMSNRAFLALFLVFFCIDHQRISRPFMTSALRPGTFFAQQEKFEHSIAQFLTQRDKSLFRVHSLLNDQKFYVPGLDMAYIFDDFTNRNYNDLADPLRSTSYAVQHPQHRGNPTVRQQFCNILSLLNVKYVLAMGDILAANMPEIIRSGNFVIYENRSCLPRVYLADKPTVVSDTKGEMLRLATSPSVGSRPLVVHKEVWAGRSLDPLLDSTIADKVQVVSYNMRRGLARMKVMSDRQQVLVFLQNYNPGWRATLNGKPVEILCVNHYAMGLVVPVGASTVEIDYNSSIATFWRKVTAITAILFAFFAVGYGGITAVRVLKSRRTA